MAKLIIIKVFFTIIHEKKHLHIDSDTCMHRHIYKEKLHTQL